MAFFRELVTEEEKSGCLPSWLARLLVSTGLIKGDVVNPSLETEEMPAVRLKE